MSASDEFPVTEDHHDDDRRIIEAVRSGDTTAIIALISTAPSSVCDVIKRFRDSQRRSLAHIAIQVDSMEVLDFVLLNGLDPDTDCEDSNGDSPVTAAVVVQNKHAVQILLSHGCNVDRCDSDLHTLLHRLAMNSAEIEDSDTSSSRSSCGIVDLIVRSGEVDVDAVDSCGNTPLHLAAVYGSPSIARALIQAGAAVNAPNQSGSTPLHFAAATGDLRIAKHLIGAGADVNVVDSRGSTPLIDAAFVSQSAAPHFAFGDQHTQSKIVRLLLENGADPDAVDRDGNNALFGAVRNGFADVIEQLGEYNGASGFQLRNNQQETLLHVAARAQLTNVSVWETLLRYCGVGSVYALDRCERSCFGIWMSSAQRLEDEDESDGSDEASQARLAAANNGIAAVSKLLLAGRYRTL